jgi:hypothetical protein
MTTWARDTQGALLAHTADALPKLRLEVMLVKAYVCLAVLLSGCAYGFSDKWTYDAGGTPPHDAGKHETSAPMYDAAVPEASDLPDVSQQQPCTLALATGIPTCDTCLGSSCCSEDDTCGGDPDCMSFINCMDACIPTDGGVPDPQCESTCQSSYPSGANELSALDNCMSVQCRSECGGP